MPTQGNPWWILVAIADLATNATAENKPAEGSQWWILAIIAGLAGLFNLIVASEKFNRKFRSPFFTPWSSLGLWWWILLQLCLPTVFFWLLFGSAIQQPIAPEKFPDLVTKAITFGLGFTPFVNANIDLGFAGLPLGEFYFVLTQLAYRQIEAGQRGRLAAFQTDLQQELSQNPNQLEAGLNYLKNYLKDDTSRKLEEERELLKQIEAAQAQTSQKEKIDAIVSLLREVRAKDYFDALKRFGCGDSFLQQYFPKQLSKSKPPNP